MIWTGHDHECGHPLVTDNQGDKPRCSVCHGSLSWRMETRPNQPHPHHLTVVA